MAFGWSGAAAGASDALTQMLVQKRLEQMQQAQLAMQQQAAAQRAAEFEASQGLQRDRFGLDRERFTADEANRTAQRDRQAKLDDVAAGDRRQAQNAVGVRRMIGDFLVQRGAAPLDPGARQTLQGMALQEGVDLPAQITTDPDAKFNDQKRVIDLQHRNRLAEISAAGAQSRQTAASKPAPQGRGVLAGDANKIAELRSSLDDLGTLRRTIAAPGESGATGAMAKLGAMVPNVITETTGFGTAAKQKQAVIDRVKQVIGKALEGGVLRKEDEAKYARILPTISDVDDVVMTKLQGLESAISQRLEQQIEALEQAGYNVGGFSGVRLREDADTALDRDALLDELLGASQ